MKLSNFNPIERTGDVVLNHVYHATVDVESGPFWNKKTVTEAIQRTIGNNWFFVSTGHFVDREVYNLERAWKAQNVDKPTS